MSDRHPRDADKIRPKTSHGFRPSSRSSHRDFLKRSSTPAVGPSSRSNSEKEKVFSGRKGKRSKKVQALEPLVEEEGGASLKQPDPDGDPDNAPSAQDEYEELASNSTYWTWSSQFQNWYHIEANGDVRWAARQMA